MILPALATDHGLGRIEGWRGNPYVAMLEEPDVWLVNFTIVPSNLNIELRLAKYFTVEKEHKSELGMWHQNNWPTFGLRQTGQDKAIELLSGYIDRQL